MTKYESMMNEALEALKENDDLFLEMVDELDSWNGFADCYRAWDMSELDEFYAGKTVSEFLNDLVEGSFNLNDGYFYFSIYGLESTDNKETLYRDNADEGEVLDSIIENANHLYFSDKTFEALIDDIIHYEDSEEQEEA